jgi:ornithine--oxo-acid transaminase
VLCDDEIMLSIKPGQHGSTFGGNPVAAAVTLAALQVVEDESLMQNARRQGKVFRDALQERIAGLNLVLGIRGKGLLNAVLINDSEDSTTAWDLCVALSEAGLLAKPTHGNIIRFAPPLVINDQEMAKALAIIESVFTDYDASFKS